MKLINHDAATLARRGSCPRNPCLALVLSLVFGLAMSGQVFAQNNFTFSGFVAFTDGVDTHVHEFVNWGQFGQNVPLPYFVALDGIAPPLFHLSCSDPLLGNIAQVDLSRTPGSLQNPPSYDGWVMPSFADGAIVTVTDFSIARQGPGGGAPVCEPERPEISKTAFTSFDREYEWDISKSATPTEADIFFGDSQSFGYTVDVFSTGYFDLNFRVFGEITIFNDLNRAIVITAVTDNFPGADNMDVDCPVELPHELASGATLVCDYSADSTTGEGGTNLATVNYTDEGFDRFGGALADFAFGGDPENEINTTVNVTDSFDSGAAVVVGSCSVADSPCTFGESLSRSLTCSDIDASESGDTGSKTNTASIVETNDSDSATVTLTCYAPSVTKTAVPAFTREYFWTVTKALEGDDPPLLTEGQSYELVYTIDVDLDVPAYTDSAYGVSGSITVDNPAPIAAVVNSVTDVFTGGSNIVVDCGDDAPFTIAAEGSLVCTYSGDSAGTEGTNTATAVQQNYARAATMTATGTTSYNGTAEFAFVTPTTLVNACVDVIDILSVDGMEIDFELLIQAGFDPDEASVCSGDVLPARFSYSFEETWFSAGDFELDPPICELLVDNTAEVIEFDRSEEAAPETLADSSVQTTLLNANCTPEGCTLTQGYWKTHSAYGPAPYDDNWARVGNIGDDGWDALGLLDVCTGDQCGEDTPFFGGDTWYNVFWTPPAGGNVYYSLAHQYMAATLNVLNGATIPAHVFDAWQEATTLFGRCGAQDFARTTRGRWGLPGGHCEGDRGRANELAGLLDSYNNGYEGVLHCSDVEYDD